MRINRVVGFPIVLTGLAFLAVGLDLGGLLHAAQSADLQDAILLGPATVSVATATLLEILFLVIGAATVVFGAIVRFRGTAPSAE